MNRALVRAVAIVAFVAVNLLGGCGGLLQPGKEQARWSAVPTRKVERSLQPADGWQEFKDETFDFSIRTPCTLRLVERPEDDGDVRAYSCNDGELVYVISATNEGCGSEREFASLAQVAENAYLKSVKKEGDPPDNAPEFKLLMPPYYGRQSRVTTGSEVRVIRVVASQRNLYFLICSGPAGSIDARVDAFLDGLQPGATGK
ncbi:MAG TPA: hypothetical protein VFV34_15005 [Blastocatellia bacterium]|nr:hypothetical protein [Blastocatellia bacterium]